MIRSFLRISLLFGIVVGPVFAEKMPREDVVEFSAEAKGFRFHHLFQTNMVVQRDKPLRFWGWGKAGESVAVQMAGKTADGRVADDGRWEVSFPSMEANAQAQKVVAKSGGVEVVLENVLVGDVWIAGGQSNMEFELAKVESGNLEIASARYPEIRLLTIPYLVGGDEEVRDFARLHEWSGWFKRHFRKGDWDVCGPETVKEFSAIAYAFARRVHMASGVPVGVIDISRGGTTVEGWTPDEAMRKLGGQPVKNLLAEWDEKVASYDAKKDLEERQKKHAAFLARMAKQGKKVPANRQKAPDDLRPGPVFDKHRPGNCYEGMVKVIEGLAVKGVIFHQGFNNCFKGTEGAKAYREIFPELVRSWRKAFRDEALPFGILSLCTAGEKQGMENFTRLMVDAGPWIREAQYQTFREFADAGDKNVGFASCYDLRRRWYHPQLKLPAGERLARWALASYYGFERNFVWKPSQVTKMEVKEGEIQLSFDDRVRHVDDGGGYEGFAIAGEDRVFHPAEADQLVIGKDGRGRDRKDPKVLVLKSEFVKNPVHFRYAWARNPMGNLRSQREADLPLATMRSDDWPMEEYVENGQVREVDPRRLKGIYGKVDEERLKK